MSKRKEKFDPNQMALDFSFEQKVNEYIEKRLAIQSEIDNPNPSNTYESEYEYSVEIAVAIKRAIRESGLSREQVVDGINAYFNRTGGGVKADPPKCRNPLTINMFNKYLSKPEEAPIPAYFIFAIMNVCDSLEPIRAFADFMGAKVASGSEIRQLTLGKIEDNLNEMRKLKKELKVRR